MSSQCKSGGASGSSRMPCDRGGNQSNTNHRKSPSSGCESDDSVGALDETGWIISTYRSNQKCCPYYVVISDDTMFKGRHTNCLVIWKKCFSFPPFCFICTINIIPVY